jgi:hypothetical protein
MLDWLFEGRLLVYGLLVIAAVALVFLWRRDRRFHWLFGAGVIVALIGVYLLLDLLVETRREQITRKLQVEFPTAVRNRDAARIFEHISDTFRLGDWTKADFRASVEEILRDRGVDDLEIWNIQFPDDEGNVSFFAKPKGRMPGTDMFYLVRATFVLENGQWRMASFTVSNPYSDSNTPIDVQNYLPRPRK